MSHPKNEEWMAFLYEDLESIEKSRLESHLKTCAPCQAQVAGWRATMNTLDADHIPSRTPARFKSPAHWLRWSAAAAIFLAAGVGIGSAMHAREDKSQVTAALRSRLEKAESESAQTRAQLVALTEAVAANRAQDQAALLATIRELRTYRKDLETVAALTEESLQSAQSQLVRLASYASPND